MLADKSAKNSDNYSRIKEKFLDFKANLPKHFQKNQGRNFTNFLAKEYDDFIKSYLNETMREFFDEFVPQNDSFALSVLATGKYAQTLLSANSELEILLVYKNLKGYNIKNFLKEFSEILDSSGMKFVIKIAEVDEIFINFKDDLKFKSETSQLRYICGSKSLYRLVKSEIIKIKEFDKKAFLNYHLKAFLPFSSISYLAQEPNLKSGFGGIDEIYHLNCILNCLDSDVSVRSQALKVMNEKEIASFNLNVDFLLSLLSALNLTQNTDTFSASSVEITTNFMQTKSKKLQDNESVISQKMLSSMNNVAIYSRFIAASLCRPFFKSELSFEQRKFARLKNGFYEINGVIYVPLHKRPALIEDLINELLELKDVDYKFDISAIFYIKRAIITKDGLERYKRV